MQSNCFPYFDITSWWCLKDPKPKVAKVVLVEAKSEDMVKNLKSISIFDVFSLIWAGLCNNPISSNKLSLVQHQNHNP